MFRSPTRPGQGGFTLVEALVGMLFTAILLPVTLDAIRLTTETGVLAARQRQAARLAGMKLTELTVTEEWRRGALEGDFEPDYPGYAWRVLDDTWDDAGMRTLAVEVSFESQGEARQVTLWTLTGEALE